ncbi:hypothetical protein, partial [Parachitinimonas caeni]
ANGRPLISGADGRWREARWLEPGRYDLTMRAYWGDQPYQFRLRPVAAEAQALLAGQALTARFDDSQQSQLFRLEGHAGDRLRFNALADNSGQLGWRLFNAYGQLLAEGPVTSDGPLRTLAQDGPVYLQLRPDSVLTAPVSVSFQLDQGEPAVESLVLGQ